MSSQLHAPESEPAHAPDYCLHVGDPQHYDIGAALQFNLLTTLGLRDRHYLLDIGCGSLRAGRLFIPYLQPGRYFGIEPLEWLVKKGIEEVVGKSTIEIKKPTFQYDDGFNLTRFQRKFDFLLAQSIFSHASPAQFRKCLSEAAQVMAPGSIFAATFFEGLSNYEGDQWVVHADYTMDKVRELVEEQGLILRPIEWDQPDLQRWVLILHGKTTVELPDFNAVSRIVHLESELARAREQLLRIRSHPFMRVGRKIKDFLVAVRFTRRRIRRAILGR